MEEEKEPKTEKEAAAAMGGQSAEAKKIAPKEKNTGMAMVAYIVFFIPLLTESKDDPFVKFHVKQGLTLFVAWIAMGFASMIPLIGWTLAPFLSLAMLALMVIGIMNANKGEKKPLPLIGKYADNFKI
ncbi:MAG: DUF4870 domain-containing protein [Candidatus Nealsonbacteria bacterium DGGOD1a]|jgi:Predicted membrane protein|nr:MAG: DUF4870 domain-containing protein [Candidatus Nealsonbacteria bacterium DGGOD1a]